MNTKQYILINKDLNLSIGKACSAAAHASLKCFFDRLNYRDRDFNEYCIKLTDEERDWKDGIFTKITLEATQEQIYELTHIANKYYIMNSIIEDCGKTEVEPGSITAAAIGPFDTENMEYKELIGKLKGLKLLK